MREDFPITDYLRLLQERPDVSSNQVRQIIEYWAAQNDSAAAIGCFDMRPQQWWRNRIAGFVSLRSLRTRL